MQPPADSSQRVGVEGITRPDVASSKTRSEREQRPKWDTPSATGVTSQVQARPEYRPAGYENGALRSTPQQRRQAARRGARQQPAHRAGCAQRHAETIPPKASSRNETDVRRAAHEHSETARDVRTPVRSAAGTQAARRHGVPPLRADAENGSGGENGTAGDNPIA